MDLHVGALSGMDLGGRGGVEDYAESPVHQCIYLYIDGSLVSCIFAHCDLLFILSDGINLYGLYSRCNDAIHCTVAVLWGCVARSQETDV